MVSLIESIFGSEFGRFIPRYRNCRDDILDEAALTQAIDRTEKKLEYVWRCLHLANIESCHPFIAGGFINTLLMHPQGGNYSYRTQWESILEVGISRTESDIDVYIFSKDPDEALRHLVDYFRYNGSWIAMSQVGMTINMAVNLREDEDDENREMDFVGPVQFIVLPYPTTDEPHFLTYRNEFVNSFDLDACCAWYDAQTGLHVLDRAKNAWTYRINTWRSTQAGPMLKKRTLKYIRRGFDVGIPFDLIPSAEESIVPTPRYVYTSSRYMRSLTSSAEYEPKRKDLISMINRLFIDTKELCTKSESIKPAFQKFIAGKGIVYQLVGEILLSSSSSFLFDEIYLEAFKDSIDLQCGEKIRYSTAMTTNMCLYSTKIREMLKNHGPDYHRMSKSDRYRADVKLATTLFPDHAALGRELQPIEQMKDLLHRMRDNPSMTTRYASSLYASIEQNFEKAIAFEQAIFDATYSEVEQTILDDRLTKNSILDFIRYMNQTIVAYFIARCRIIDMKIETKSIDAEAITLKIEDQPLYRQMKVVMNAAMNNILYHSKNKSIVLSDLLRSSHKFFVRLIVRPKSIREIFIDELMARYDGNRSSDHEPRAIPLDQERTFGVLEEEKDEMYYHSIDQVFNQVSALLSFNDMVEKIRSHQPYHYVYMPTQYIDSMINDYRFEAKPRRDSYVTTVERIHQCEASALQQFLLGGYTDSIIEKIAEMSFPDIRTRESRHKQYMAQLKVILKPVTWHSICDMIHRKKPVFKHIIIEKDLLFAY